MDRLGCTACLGLRQLGFSIPDSQPSSGFRGPDKVRLGDVIALRSCNAPPQVAAPAAIISAIEDALAPFGVRFADMPLTPDRIVDALRKAGAYDKLAAA